MCGATCRSERGLSTSVQWAVLLPLLLGVLVAACDAATYLHARVVVEQAASTAAGRAALADAGPGAAVTAVAEMTRPTAVAGFDVAVRRAPDHVVATIDAEVRLISGVRHVRHTASAPKERVT